MPDPSSSLAPFPWLDVAVIIGLVCLNGVFAMSELAIVSSRKARLKALAAAGRKGAQRSEEHTSELQSLMRISYAVFCLTTKNKKILQQTRKRATNHNNKKTRY